jgi:hypothetical protein
MTGTRRTRVSPERETERVVADAIASSIRRARVLALGEAVAWGLAVAAVSPVAGALLAAAIGAWRWRTTSRVSVVRTLEHDQPGFGNLLVTADELARDTLTAKPPVRARVFADAAARVQHVDLRAAFPIAPLIRIALLAAVVWTTVEMAHLWRSRATRERGAVASQTASSGDTSAGSPLQVSIAIEPPAYTGLPETKAVNPEQLQAIEGSSLVLSIDAAGPRVIVEHDGRSRTLTRGADGHFTERLPVTTTGYILVTADDGEAAPKSLARPLARRMVPIVVTPDALPAVRLTAPARDLVYAGGNPRIAFDARATDDFGLRSLALRYTKVSGSGENFEFQEGEIPLTVTRANTRDWGGSVSRSLAELNLKEGDMLVYRAVAADARPGDGSASSDAFFIEISKLGVAAGDAFTLPQEESKYALSQQMLIVKTERLHQRRAALPPADFTEQALNLAVEQRMIRAEFVFMLGGEVDDEEVEAEQSVELQAGRLQNRGQRDLRAATLAMSQAEKLLTGASTAEALVAERAAVTALQRAFSRDRYILRALATRSQLDPARRLTGSLGEASGWRRTVPDTPANRRTALLQDLLKGIAELTTVRPSRSSTVRLKPDTTETTTEATTGVPVVSGFSRTRALVLAEEAIRLDPASAAMRQTATELQRAADAADPAARSTALASAAAAAAAESRRSQAAAPLAVPVVSPALSGAFADAMSRRPRR